MTELLTSLLPRPAIKASLAVLQKEGCSIAIGTCGYSYVEWVDNGFYSPQAKNSEMLSQYCHQFAIVEINYTWYQVPQKDAIKRLVQRSPAHFQFTAKISRHITHERPDDLERYIALYKQGITPLKQQLTALLIQLPSEFTYTTSNRLYLARILDGFAEFPLAVEFRHPSWAMDSVFMELEKRKISLVTVDVPPLPHLFPSLDVVTNPNLLYIRFHGRNTVGWQSGSMQKKFDYNYSLNELKQFHQQYLAPMLAQSSHGVVFFNNHVKAQAPRNARSFGHYLEQG